MMKWPGSGALVLLLILTAGAVGEDGAGDSPTDIHPWDVYELEMTAERELSGPYVEGLPEGGPGYVSVTFHGEHGAEEGRQFKVTGFWDGGRTWRGHPRVSSAGGLSRCRAVQGLGVTCCEMH